MRLFISQLVIVTILFSACGTTNLISNEGGLLVGVVEFEEGNQFLSKEKGSKKAHLQRDIYIFELANVKDTKRDGIYFGEIGKNLVAIQKTKKNGAFKIKLPVGRYSIITKEPQGFFSSEFDKDNNLHPIVVKVGEKTFTTILINYNAYY